MRKKNNGYYDFMKKASDEVIIKADNGLYYLEPAFRVILNSNGLNPSDVKDYEINWEAVKEYLQLEVEKRNTVENKKPTIIDWLYNTLTSVVEPSILEEETEYIKNLKEYLMAKNVETESLK